MQGRHSRSVRARGCATFDAANRIFESTDGRISVARVNVAGNFTAEDLIDFVHRLVRVGRAGIDRRGSWSAGWPLVRLTAVNQLCCYIWVVFFVSHVLLDPKPLAHVP